MKDALQRSAAKSLQSTSMVFSLQKGTLKSLLVGSEMFLVISVIFGNNKEDNGYALVSTLLRLFSANLPTFSQLESTLSNYRVSSSLHYSGSLHPCQFRWGSWTDLALALASTIDGGKSNYSKAEAMDSVN